MVFVTLFDSGYLDKGLALIQSLHETCGGAFRLYVVAFDDLCYQILSQYRDDSLTVISLLDFESPQLLKAKNNRTPREYYWTCSCHSIKYVLETYGETQCTYIDADMYFYQNPQVLFDEIQKSGCDVSIIEHGFVQNKEGQEYINNSGKYCVEFNTFFSTENGMHILNWWCDRCLECCTEQTDGALFGDQKYLDDWPNRFERVHVIKNPGAGVAPWNLAKNRLVSKQGKDIILMDKKSKLKFPLVFYHYHNISYCAVDKVDIHVHRYPHNVSISLRDAVYREYFQIINKYRDMLRKVYNYDMDANVYYQKKKSKLRMILGILLFERPLFTSIKMSGRVLFRKEKDFMCIR